MKDIKVLLSDKKNIVITMHKNPDCDALGSSLGLAHILGNIGHKVKVISPNSYPEFLNWLPGQEKVLNYENNIIESENVIADSDIIFCLDFNNLKRLGEMKTLIEKSNSYKILIDHHEDPNNFCDFMFSMPSKSSTCEMIYDFAVNVGLIDKIDSDEFIEINPRIYVPESSKSLTYSFQLNFKYENIGNVNSSQTSKLNVYVSESTSNTLVNFGIKSSTPTIISTHITPVQLSLFNSGNFKLSDNFLIFEK